MKAARYGITNVQYTIWTLWTTGNEMKALCFTFPPFHLPAFSPFHTTLVGYNYI